MSTRSSKLAPGRRPTLSYLASFLLLAPWTWSGCDCEDSTEPSSDPTTATITSPEVDVSIPQGTEVDFTGAATSSVPASYHWIFGDPTIDDQFVLDPDPVTYANLGAFTVSFSVTGGEVASDSLIVTVKAALLAQIEPVDDPIVVMAGESVDFGSTVSSGTPPYTYAWNFDGQAAPSTDADPAPVTFSSVGMYEVSLEVTDANAFVVTDMRSVQVGTATSPCPFDAPVAIAVQPPGFARESGTGFVWSANDGFRVCDLFSGESYADLTDRGATRLLELVMVDNGVNERYGLFSAFEPSGLGLTFFDNETQEASLTIVSAVGTVSHLFPFDHHQGILITSAGSNTVSARTYDASSDSWTQSGSWSSFHFPGANGNVILAATRRPNGGTFFVTDGAPGDPASVWMVPDWSPSDPSTFQVNTGVAPRDMCLEGSVFAVANFGSEEVITYHFDENFSVTIGDTLPVGPAVAMDSRTLPSGDMELAVAVDGDTIALIEVSRMTGEVLSVAFLNVATTAPDLTDVRYVGDSHLAAASRQLDLTVPITLP